jgi:hypothetical protein
VLAGAHGHAVRPHYLAVFDYMQLALRQVDQKPKLRLGSIMPE